MSSCLGSVGVSPYADEEAAETTRFTPASRAAISTFSVPSTLTALLRAGSATERGTEGVAACAARNPLPGRRDARPRDPADRLPENQFARQPPEYARVFRSQNCRSHELVRRVRATREPEPSR